MSFSPSHCNTNQPDDIKRERSRCNNYLSFHSQISEFFRVANNLYTKYINRLHTSSESFINKFVHRLL